MFCTMMHALYLFGALNIVAVALMIAATATKGWLVFTINLDNFHITTSFGLFEATFSTETQTITRSTSDLGVTNYGLTTSFVEYKAEAITAIVLSIVATVFIFVYRCTNARRWPLIVAVVCNLLSAISEMVLIGRFISMRQMINAYPYSQYFELKTSYSMIIAGVAVIITVAVLISLIVVICKANNQQHVQSTVTPTGVANPQYNDVQQRVSISSRNLYTMGAIQP